MFTMSQRASLAAQTERSVVCYIFEWQPNGALLHIGQADPAKRFVYRTDDTIPAEALTPEKIDALLRQHDPAPKRALLHIHCLWGNAPFFHPASLGWLQNALNASSDKTPVALIAVKWPTGGLNYVRNWHRAADKGAAFAPALSVLSQYFDGNLDLFCHSMGNRFLQGALGALPDDTALRFRQVVLFSADLDADVFDTDFKRLADWSQRIHLYRHNYDRPLFNSTVLHGRKRLGRAGLTSHFRPANLTEVDMTPMIRLDHSYHNLFSKKKVQRHLGEIW
jgi:hypothetical protein